MHTVEPHWPIQIAGRDDFGPIEDELLEEVNDLFRRSRSLRRDVGRSRRTNAEAGELEAVNTELRDVSGALAGNIDEIFRMYDTAVRQADDNFAGIQETLERAGHWDDTILVFVSDHGEEMLDHGTWLHDQSLHSELIHVPLILRVPGITDGGRRVPEPVQLVDVMPTLLELLDLPAHPQVQGRSMVPLLRDGAPEGRSSAISVRLNRGNHDPDHFHLRGDRESALVQGRWKLIAHHDLESASLYDRESDSGEARDLAQDHPDVVEELSKRLDAWHEWQDAVRLSGATEVELNPEQMELLRDLGYVD